MNDEIFDDIALEELCKRAFKVNIDVKKVVARAISTGFNSQANVFITTKNTLFVLIRSEGPLVLADVTKIIRSMGMEPDIYLPPMGEKTYFDDYGRQKFESMFPNRKVVNDSDIEFYCTLAPYNPALVRITRVKDEIRQYDLGTRRWEKLMEYSYSKMKVKTD